MAPEHPSLGAIPPEAQAELLSQALPFMQRYTGRRVVVKFGGNAMVDPALSVAFARDVALLQQSGARPIVVHGGGPQIGRTLERMGVKSTFRNGLRVTDRATVEVVEMVLSGSINKGLVADFGREGARAIGLSGKDGNMVRARRLRRTERDPDSAIERIVDLGFVGEPVEVDVDVLVTVAEAGLIPVVAPVAAGMADEEGSDGAGRDGGGPDGGGGAATYNVNADTFAGAIAGALGAERLLFLTDVPGVLDRNGRLIRELSVAEARALIADGTVSGGMIPKVETAIAALEAGVGGVVIVDGTAPHAVMLELFTAHGAGTLIRP